MSIVPITACEWRIGPPPTPLDLRPQLRVVERPQIDGSIRYVVFRGGWVATRDHAWEYEPTPSSRDEAFIARTRFEDWEDAMWCAQHMARHPEKWDTDRRL